MKRVMTYIKIASAALLLAVLQGCGGRISETLSLSNTNLETRIATTTELLIDNMANTYNEAQELAFESEYDGVVAGILSSSSDSHEASPLISDSLILRMQLLTLYKQAVHEYALLADDSFKGKTGMFATCCNSIHDIYKTIDDSIAQSFSKQVMPLVRAARYDKNSVSRELIASLAMVWDKDVDALSNQLNTSFKDYQTSLAAIPDDSFDEEKLAKHVSAPHNGKHNLAEVYKIELIKQRRAQLHALIQRQIDITSSLQYLQNALIEFVKKDGENDVVMNYLKRIELLLGGDVKADKE